MATIVGCPDGDWELPLANRQPAANNKIIATQTPFLIDITSPPDYKSQF